MGFPLRAWAAADRSGGRCSVYREFAPVPAISGAAARVWEGVPGWNRRLRILPDGCADLVWDGHSLDVVITGGAPQHRLLPKTARTLGLRLYGGAAGTLLGMAVSELPAGATRLAELWGPEAERAEQQLAALPPASRRHQLEMLVAARLRSGFTPDPLAVAAAHALGTAGAKPADVAADVGVSERGLRRILRQETGCGPKQLQRIGRFRRFHRKLPALAQGRVSLAVTAAELGYADQSHLGRECRRLSGSSPAELVRSWAHQDALAEKFQTARPEKTRIGFRDHGLRNQ